MSLLNKASLIQIPSGYKDGTLYSAKPTNGDGDFTFSRGSNLAATRTNSEGLIEKGRENLLLQSNSFNTTWSNVLSGSITSGQSGYDGTDNAWKLSKGATAYRYIIQSLSVSGVYAFSLYAKADTLNQVTIFNDTGGSSPYAKFSLVDGSVVASSGLIDSSATDVGNGWWRLSATFNTTITTARIYPDFAETTSGSIYIQSAQLEQGLIATDYIPTTTTTEQAGILEDMPRLDYSGGASCPSLLLEPQRTNLFEHSDYLSSSFWFDDDITRVQNTTDTLSPEGVYNAVKLTETATNARHRLASNTITITNANYSASVFLKKGTARYGFVHLSGANAYTIVVDLEDGTITDTATNDTILHQSVEDYGNGWYRCSIAGNMAAVTTQYVVQFGTAGSATPSYNNYVPTYLGSTSNNIYAYGAQLEAGSYPTSYIPTYGASSTRSKDSISTTFSSSLTSGGEVSVLFDIDGAYNSNSNSTGDNLAFIFSNDDRIIWNQNSNGFHRIEINVEGGTEYIYLTTSVDRVDRAKICIVVTASTYAMYVNGSLETSGSFTGTGNWTSADEFSDAISEAIAVVPIEQLLYFPTALTSSEAIDLTTI